MSTSLLLSCGGVANRPGLCPIAQENVEAAPTLCTEYGPNGWMGGPFWCVLKCPIPKRMISCLLSSELQHLNICIAALSEVRRLDSGEIMAGGYTYYWSGRSDCYYTQVVGVAMSNKLTAKIIEITPVNERIRR